MCLLEFCIANEMTQADAAACMGTTWFATARFESNLSQRELSSGTALTATPRLG